MTEVLFFFSYCGIGRGLTGLSPSNRKPMGMRRTRTIMRMPITLPG